MQTKKITVNKTKENPKGTELEIIEPQGTLESRLMAFMLKSLLTEAERLERLAFKLPKGFLVEYQREGSFIVSGVVSDDESKAGDGLYQLPRPVAVVGIRAVGTRFDLISAKINPEALKAGKTPAPAKAKD